MGLMDAQEYDPRPAQRRWRLIGLVLVMVLVAFLVWWNFRYWPEEQIINRFFGAIERKDFDAAYGLYNADPNWKQHPEKYNQYSLSQFMLDWGPSSEYGPINSHRIDCATEPKKKGFASPSGVIVVVTVNQRSDSTSLWVEKRKKTITTSPWTVLCHAPK
jgi:hypothetical protein